MLDVFFSTERIRLADRADPSAVRVQRVTALVAPWCAILHAGFAIAFAAMGRWPLAAFNLGFSVPAWIVAAVLLRRGHFVPGASLIYVETLAHGAAASLALGWETGFLLYGAVLVAMAGAGGTGRTGRAAMVLAACSFAVWFVLFVLLRGRPPLDPPDPALAAAMYAFNWIGMLAILGGILAGLVRVTDRAEKALALEHERSERLLRNILPEGIATRLKGGEALIADGIGSASVLFADIVGFTGLSARTSPTKLVETLNAVFTRIDALAEKHGLEKIKTIGDAYMVASGVPETREDHGARLAAFALDLVRVLDDLDKDGVGLQMRIGMHAGPLVAGVIGTRKFAYDLWGDTVNTAARMESHGLPGQVQVTAEMKAAIGPGFRFEPRGTIDVKGKGALETWFLVGRDGAGEG